jgi:hypothetical protein
LGCRFETRLWEAAVDDVKLKESTTKRQSKAKGCAAPTDDVDRVFESLGTKDEPSEKQPRRSSGGAAKRVDPTVERACRQAEALVLEGLPTIEIASDESTDDDRHDLDTDCVRELLGSMKAASSKDAPQPPRAPPKAAPKPRPAMWDMSFAKRESLEPATIDVGSAQTSSAFY